MGIFCEVQMVFAERDSTSTKADAASGACKSNKDSPGPAPLRNPTSLHRPTASLIIFCTIADWHAFGSYGEGSHLLLRCLGSRSPFHHRSPPNLESSLERPRSPQRRAWQRQRLPLRRRLRNVICSPYEFVR
ncbi:hypothetical protein VTO73DRAFT_11718 [Trametes versicolor]